MRRLALAAVLSALRLIQEMSVAVDNGLAPLWEAVEEEFQRTDPEEMARQATLRDIEKLPS